MDIYLETSRMILRKFTSEDVNLLVDLDSDPQVMQYINGGTPTPAAGIRDKVLPRMLEYYDTYADLGFWIALLKDSQEFIGWFHMRPYRPNPAETELGWRLKRAYWGQGLATEGARALAQKGFEELGSSRMVAIADPDNAASIRVMEKAGLTFEDTHAEPDGFIVVKYGLDAETYIKNK